MKKIIITLLSLSLAIQLYSQKVESSGFENSDAYPLIGNWTGEWNKPQEGHEKQPELAAQINLIDGNTYLVCLLPRIHARSVPFLEVQATEENGGLSFNQDGWEFTFKDGIGQGTGALNGQKVAFYLKKSEFTSPTAGLPPPDGAVVLFDGTNFDHWKHDDNRPVSWKLVTPGVMETVSAFWRQGQNRKEGIGGTIETKEKFSDLKFHLEFRYAVEPGKKGQQRGNSGLFFNGIGEIQILNSFALPGYWDDCGAIYKRYPPMVNAAGPPLQWQTYDVDLQLPRFNANGEKLSNAILTVRLNGIIIHSHLEVESNAAKVSIGLQDHINCLQYRNIWVLEK